MCTGLPSTLVPSSRTRSPLPGGRRAIAASCCGGATSPERRTFHPHITLARWKGRRTRELAGFLERKRGLVSEPWEVDAFILFESRLSRHGAHYEEVAAYALG